jgi:hypothetical protein
MVWELFGGRREPNEVKVTSAYENGLAKRLASVFLLRHKDEAGAEVDTVFLQLLVDCARCVELDTTDTENTRLLQLLKLYYSQHPEDMKGYDRLKREMSEQN